MTSINVGSMIGGSAASIDTTSLISSLMAGAAVPQNQLKDQLTALTSVQNAYQAINTDTTLMQGAAQAVTDPTAWNATSATSSSSTVVATSNSTATAGSTTFDVIQLAHTQVDTIAADDNGDVVSDPTAGITITGSDNEPHLVPLTAGDAATVAAAINLAGAGVRASVVTTDQGTRLQLSAAKSGSAGGFSSDGFINAAQNVVPAQDAQVSVGDITDGGTGYSVTSSSNTFTGLIPGVTFSVSALATNVSISVATDSQSISNKIKSLVAAANTATGDISKYTAQGGVLQSQPDPRNIIMSIMSAVSTGTSAGSTLSTYGIDMDKNGVISFNASTFASAFAADPGGTQAALSGSFATNVNAAADAAIAPVTGTVAQDLSAGTATATQLNTEINNWTTKLAAIQTTMSQKFTTMQTMLAKLQSQQTYLTSMFNSITASQKSS